MNRIQTVQISQAMSEDVKRLLSLTEAEESEKETAVIVSYTATFNDGVEVDLKVCNGDTGPWLDAVIFDEYGQELYALPPEFEKLEGEYLFEIDKDTYTVIVEVR